MHMSGIRYQININLIENIFKAFAYVSLQFLNPRTDRGMGHLSTDGGRINASPKISKTKKARDKR